MTLTRPRLIAYATTHRIPELHWAHDMLRALDTSGAEPPCLTRYILLSWLAEGIMYFDMRHSSARLRDWARLDDAASAADPAPHLAAIEDYGNKKDADRALRLAAQVEDGSLTLPDAIRKLGGTPYETTSKDTAT
jgi:hypothetical protein